MKFNNDQEKFWTEEYNQEYIRKNSNFDHKLGSEGWEKMLESIPKNTIKNFLECGCNIGRNLEQLKILNPDLIPSVLDLNRNALEVVSKKYNIDKVFCGSLIDCDFDINSFDLVFTQGVLIHINPDHLLLSMQKMYELSSKYILIGEYFNRTSVSILYQGEEDRLFKRDFGKMFLENFNVKLIDYGFLWGHIYDSAGHDDITWWLFEK
jgi:pseudaminic acid biosynthesis-associated methylase